MKEKIAVLMGGRSLEREVSLRSGERVFTALTQLGYRALALDVTPELVDTLRREKPDAVYIALHGKFGEDGTVQEALDFLGIRYTGPGVIASALAWDKALSKRLFAQAGIPTPPWVTFTSDAFKEMGAASALDLVPGAVGGFPVCVKPSKQGSALGLTRVEDAAHLPDALLTALSYGDAALVEKWVDGTELAVSVVDGADGPEVFPPVEMVAKSGVFDYTAAYTAGATDYYCPARLPDDVTLEVERLARECHTLLGCRGVSRTDMVVDEAGRPLVLEVNTSPGMTETSLLPMAAAAAGTDFASLVGRMVRVALDRVE
ncbi:MAG: D-alanine--D-alanine ligase [Coriobacteriia bacterium]|nr:D-alanine--D-alanine ligase [Coriobacteriia bacterium]